MKSVISLAVALVLIVIVTVAVIVIMNVNHRHALQLEHIEAYKLLVKEADALPNLAELYKLRTTDDD